MLQQLIDNHTKLIAILQLIKESTDQDKKLWLQNKYAELLIELIRKPMEAAIEQTNNPIEQLLHDVFNQKNIS